MDLAGWLFGGNKLKLDVVHHSDLESLLKSMGKYSEVKENIIPCEVCYKRMSLEDVGKIRMKNLTQKDENIIRFRCKDTRCISINYIEDIPERRIQRLDSYPEDVVKEEIEESIDNPIQWDRKESAFAGKKK